MGEVGENPYQNAFKNPGHLEIKGMIEPLPPTRITDDAQKRLETWGFTKEEVYDVRSFTSQFRYDLCPEKVARLSQKPTEVFSREERDYVNLPLFYDINGRLDGQCGDIGRQWVIQINESNLIKKLNQRGENQVVTAFYTGLSETHFCNEWSNHVWNGLVLLDKDGDIVDEIYFDAAFQSIHSKQESKYTQKTATYHSRSIESKENAEVPVGLVEIDGNKWRGNVSGTVVLGVSSDYKFGYALSFLRDIQTNAIRPVLNRISKDGSGDYYIIGNEDQVLASTDARTSSDHEKEIEQILREAQKLSFVEKPPTENRVTWIKNDIDG